RSGAPRRVRSRDRRAEGSWRRAWRALAERGPIRRHRALFGGCLASSGGLRVWPGGGMGTRQPHITQVSKFHAFALIVSPLGAQTFGLAPAAAAAIYLSDFPTFELLDCRPCPLLRPMDSQDLIYDWNLGEERWEGPPFRVQLDDETLRDGLQSPSVKTPAIE